MNLDQASELRLKPLREIRRRLRSWSLGSLPRRPENAPAQDEAPLSRLWAMHPWPRGRSPLVRHSRNLHAPPYSSNQSSEEPFPFDRRCAQHWERGIAAMSRASFARGRAMRWTSPAHVSGQCPKPLQQWHRQSGSRLRLHHSLARVLQAWKSARLGRARPSSRTLGRKDHQPQFSNLDARSFAACFLTAQRRSQSWRLLTQRAAHAGQCRHLLPTQRVHNVVLSS